MRTIFTLLLFFTLFRTSEAQTCEWIRGHETNYEMNPDMLRYNVCTAPDGVVWYGGLKSLVEFYTEAMGNLFLARYNSNGDLLYEYEITGSASLYDMETDSEGNLYLTGQTLNTLQFWDGTQLSYNNSFIEGFLIKVAPSGSIVWAVNLSTLFENADPEDLTIYQDHVYLVHSEWSESNITEFDEDGNVVRTIRQLDVPLATGIALDPEGNIYVSGSCSDTQGAFGGVPFPTSLQYSMYLVKYNHPGIPQWVKFAEDITCTKSKLTVDNTGRILWSGPLLTESIFDTLTLMGPSWGSDFFVTAFNGEGQVQWGFEVPQVLTGNAMTGKSRPLYILPDNSVSIAGSSRGTINWGNNVVTSSEDFSNQSMVLNISSGGEPNWEKAGLADGYSQIVAVDGDDEGNLYIAGISHGTTHFDTVSYSGISYYYPYLAKINTNLTTSVPDQEFSDQYKIYPNPAQSQITVKSDLPGQISILLCALNGQELLRVSDNGSVITIDISSIPAGIYMVKLINNSSVSVKKVIIG